MEQTKIQYAPYYNRVEQIGTEVGVRCEDRTFDEVDTESSSGREVRDDGDGKSLLPPSDNPFKPFYDQVIDPIVDMLGRRVVIYERFLPTPKGRRNGQCCCPAYR